MGGWTEQLCSMNNQTHKWRAKLRRFSSRVTRNNNLANNMLNNNKAALSRGVIQYLIKKKEITLKIAPNMLESKSIQKNNPQAQYLKPQPMVWTMTQALQCQIYGIQMDAINMC